MPKISALPAMTTADGADPAPIVDDSVTQTKKITLTKMKEWLQSLVGWITTAMIADDAVTTAKIPNDAITGPKILTLNSRRQDNTTNTAPTDIIVQHGWGFILGNGTSTVSEVVTFPQAFASPPVLVICNPGIRSGSDPANISQLSSASSEIATAAGVSASAFSAVICARDGAGTLGATFRFGYSWIAIGPKA